MINTTKLLNSLDIKQVIETYTGNRISHSKTLCPFHADHNASLTLKTEKGIWHCWACGAGGNAINFTRQLFDLTFIEACRKLSTDFNVSDIGLYEADTKRDLWDEIKADCDKERHQEIEALRNDIEQEIQELMAIHRVLFSLGYFKDAERYSQEIDDLYQYKQIWR